MARYIPYAEKLKDPRWQRKRLEIMQRDGFKCRCCGCKRNTLTVHHGHYEPGREPWDYEDETLVTLCDGCHKVIQAQMTDMHREIACCDLSRLPAILAFLRGQIREDIRQMRIARIKSATPTPAAKFVWPEGMTEDEEDEYLRKIVHDARKRQGIEEPI